MEEREPGEQIPSPYSRPFLSPIVLDKPTPNPEGREPTEKI
jgi:hypothetical protein